MLAMWVLRRVSDRTRGETAQQLEARLGPIARYATLTALAAIGVGVGLGTPHPGFSGAALGVTLAMAAAVIAGLALLAVRPGPWDALAATALGLASAALAGLDPNAPGYLGAFIGVGALPLRTSRRVAITLSALIITATTTASVAAALK